MRGRLVALACVATVTATGHAKDLSVEDVDRRFARLGLRVTAEKVAHRGQDYLLIRIQASGVRTIDRGDGQLTSVSLKEGGLAFLPVTVACASAVLRESAKTHAPDVSSPCVDSARLAHPQALPAFVAFKYPAAGTASVVVPVSVTKPDPSVQVSLNRPGTALMQGVTAALLGDHELAARVRID